MKRKETILVNLFAGPGTGKSTTAAEIYVSLKKAGVSVELVREYAKELCWQGTLEETCQLDIFKEQAYRQRILKGNVDVLITDSPTIQGVVYSEASMIVNDAVIKDFKKEYTNINVFLDRTKRFVTEGRDQTEAEAKVVDHKILQLLADCEIPFSRMTTNEAVPNVIYKVLSRLAT